MTSSATLLSAPPFKDKVEEVTGKTITPTKLQEAILLVNHRRRVLQRINRLRGVQPVPISGRDVLLANQISFYDDPMCFTDSMGKLCEELEQLVGAGQGVVPGPSHTP